MVPKKIQNQNQNSELTSFCEEWSWTFCCIFIYTSCDTLLKILSFCVSISGVNDFTGMVGMNDDSVGIVDFSSLNITALIYANYAFKSSYRIKRHFLKKN
jgi:hypothetical protein